MKTQKIRCRYLAVIMTLVMLITLVPGISDTTVMAASKSKTQNITYLGVVVGTATLNYDTYMSGGRPQFVYESNYQIDLKKKDANSVYAFAIDSVGYSGDLIKVAVYVAAPGILGGGGTVYVSFTP